MIDGEITKTPKGGQTIVPTYLRHFQSTEVEIFLGDPSKANQKLGWVPEITAKQLFHKVVTTDLIEPQRLARIMAKSIK